MPISRLQYQREMDLGRSDFPSLAFQIEICHMQNEITDLCNEDIQEDEERMQRINEADAKICVFLRRVPRWKMDVGEFICYSSRVAGQKTADLPFLCFHPLCPFRDYCR